MAELDAAVWYLVCIFPSSLTLSSFKWKMFSAFSGGMFIYSTLTKVRTTTNEAVIVVFICFYYAIFEFQAHLTKHQFLCLCEMHNALQLLVFFFLFFFQSYLEYWGVWSKKILYRPPNSQYNSVNCYCKKDIFWVYFCLEQVAMKQNSLEANWISGISCKT